MRRTPAAATAARTVIAALAAAALAVPSNAAASSYAASKAVTLPAAVSTGNPTCSPASSPADGLVRQAHPVVLVHGWRGGPMGQTRTLLEERLPSGWQFLLFDYNRASGQWASAPAVAGCLAAYLDRVSDTHAAAGGDGVVYIVTHSMGGLATRFALAPKYGGIDNLGSRIGAVVTLATPHRGSPWGNSGLANLLNSFMLDAVPPGASAAGRCLAVHDAGRGLPDGCAPPPYMPATLPLMQQVEGAARIARTFFGVPAYDIVLGGDSIVTSPSASGYVGSAAGDYPRTRVRIETVPCRSDWNALIAEAGARSRNPVIALTAALAQMKVDEAALEAVQNGTASPALVELIAVANAFMPCSHIGIATSNEAIETTVHALEEGAAAVAGRAAQQRCAPQSFTRVVRQMLGPGAEYEARVLRCEGDWAYIEDVEALGDTEMVFRRSGGAWTYVTGFPTSMCPRDLAELSAPDWAVALLDYRREQCLQVDEALPSVSATADVATALVRLMKEAGLAPLLQ